MTKYYFLPPIVVEGPAGGGRLFIRFKLFKGITVLRTNGVWSEQRYSSEDVINAALRTGNTEKENKFYQKINFNFSTMYSK